MTTDKAYPWTEACWQLNGESQAKAERFHVVAYDFGAKKNILRMLVERGCKLTVVPAQTPAEEVLALNPDGVFLSNGLAILNHVITPLKLYKLFWKKTYRSLVSVWAISCWV